MQAEDVAELKSVCAHWLLSDIRLPKGVQGHPEPEHTWWRVMCLTGVDYFSTLGYQPGIAPAASNPYWIAPLLHIDALFLQFPCLLQNNDVALRF